MRKTLDVHTLDNGDQYIELDDDIMRAIGVSVGDTVKWEDNKDGSWSLRKGNTAMKRFDLEQAICNCWNVVDDIKLLNETILEKGMSQDEISNFLLGLSTIYQAKFDKAFDLFEQCTKDGELK